MSRKCVMQRWARCLTGEERVKPPASLRPGIRLGRYPLRNAEPLGRIERLLGRISLALVRQAPAGEKNRRAFTRRVDGYADQLKAYTTVQIEEQRERCRIHLLEQGFSDDNAARTFALVREVTQRTIGLRLFDAQIAAGWMLLHGLLAEMQTGEGKTLTATLPACTAALAGVPVHIITVNDYLVQRDARAMAPVYEALGLSVGTITEGMDFSARQAAYACDITYCSNKQIVFDYLKDRVATESGDSMGHGGAMDAAASSQMLRGLCFAIVDEADSVLIDDARTPLILAGGSAEAFDADTLHIALELARTLEPDSEFLVDRQNRGILLTARGKETLASKVAGLNDGWQSTLRRESLVKQALSALHLFAVGKHYLVNAGTIEIVDENTGRVMADRAWESGLQQLIELKEGCVLTDRRETLAKTSYQRFFRRYLKLAGMTGTAQEVRAELRSVYGLDVVKVPTHRPCIRKNFDSKIFWTRDAKWQAVVARIKDLHVRGQPVLVGVCSVKTSEHLGRLLDKAGLGHRVLNARQDLDEASIIARAGEAGAITVATNMAGRGTDIVLGEGVADLGGLHVLATELNHARRIARQLVGRSARQGNPGSCEAYIALDDELVKTYLGRVAGWLGRWVGPDSTEMNALAGTSIMYLAVRLAEARHRQTRKALLRMDEQRDTLLAFSGQAD